MQTVIKALQLTQMELDLVDITREIKMHEGIINSVKTRHKMKENSKNKLPGLVKRKRILVDKITEASLLDDTP